MDINKHHLDFSDIIGSILFGNFSMILPPTFLKIDNSEGGTKHQGNNVNKAEGKKLKGNTADKKEKLAVLKNEDQHKAFKMKEGKYWKTVFKSAHVSSRPTWDGEKTTKMCIKWHIQGECFDTCDCKESMAAKIGEMCTFIVKCRRVGA